MKSLKETMLNRPRLAQGILLNWGWKGIHESRLGRKPHRKGQPREKTMLNGGWKGNPAELEKKPCWIEIGKETLVNWGWERNPPEARRRTLLNWSREGNPVHLGRNVNRREAVQMWRRWSGLPCHQNFLLRILEVSGGHVYSRPIDFYQLIVQGRGAGGRAGAFSVM
jgi:hypothetical protein